MSRTTDHIINTDALRRAEEDAEFAFEERAAIMEYCGGMSRDDAERAARHQGEGNE